MKIKYLSLTIALTMFFTLLTGAAYSQDDAMKEAALNRLSLWQKTFTEQQAKQLGFASLDDFKKAELGEPFKLYTITPDAITGFQEGAEFGRIITDTDYFVYPVMTAGSNKALLWVMKKEGAWHVARIGSADLAKTIRKVKSTVESAKSERGLEGAAPPKFVRVYQLYLDFFYMSGSQGEYILPMYNIPNLNIEGNKFYNPAEFIPQLKEQLKLKMPEERESSEKNIEG